MAKIKLLNKFCWHKYCFLLEEKNKEEKKKKAKVRNRDSQTDFALFVQRRRHFA